MLTGTCHCGAATWRYDATPKSVTACNCTVCAKAGVLWIYGTEGEDAQMSGPTQVYLRSDAKALEFHHCPTCGNTIAWRLAKPNADGVTQLALNARLVDDPAAIAHLSIRHFEGFETFRALPNDHRTVKDMWF